MDQNLKANQKYHCKYNHFLPQKSANLFRIFLGTLIDLQTYQTNRFPTQEHAGSKRTSTTKIPLHHHQAPKEPQPQKYHYIIIKLLQSVFFFRVNFRTVATKKMGKFCPVSVKSGKFA
jgi:hypothetical protein